MVPSYLTVRNFLSYGEGVPTLDFSRFHVACLTGNNGHGKSALLDAITYALWGEARKSSGERKPDEGLLRLGSSEMRVEFGFLLNENSYRVIRSFRKNRRTSSTQLDLQLLDSDADAYHTLSDGASTTQTQRSINRLLSMDYETFINSAFLLQGRSDEFTQRNPRQRKQVLADILNLDRYDQLRDHARLRLQETTQRVDHLDRKLAELGERLAVADERRVELATTTQLLEAATSQVSAQERKLAQVADRLNQRTQLQGRREAREAERERSQGRRLEIESERNALATQMTADQETINSGPTIENQYVELQQLSANATRMDSQLTLIQELQLQRQGLEAQVASARHEVEREREKWDAEVLSLARQKEQSRSLLQREPTIAEAVQALEQCRVSIRGLEDDRNHLLELERQRDRCELQIQVDGDRLRVEAESLKSRNEALESRRSEISEAGERVVQLGCRLRSLEKSLADLDRVRARGTEVGGELVNGDRRLVELERAGDDLRERIELLDAADGLECPLCGNEMDREHQVEIAAELSRRKTEIADEIGQNRREAASLKAQRNALRTEFKRLDELVKPIDDVRRSLAEQQAWLRQDRELEEEAKELSARLARLDSSAAHGDFAHEHRDRQQALNAAIEALRYDETEHARLRQRIEELARAEADMALLTEAVLRNEQLEAESTAAKSQLARIVYVLEHRSYAQETLAEVEEIDERLETTGYAADEHARIRSRIDELGDVAQRREALILARQRHTSGGELLDRYARELTILERTIHEADSDLESLQRQLAALVDLDAEQQRASGELAQGRRERDELLQRRGSLQAQIDRYEEWQGEVDAATAELEKLRERAFVLQELTVAYGKDGIQALIIESAIPEIEAEANAILGRLTDNRIQISIESLRDLKKGGTRETLDIVIADEIGERSYHLYSGGEAFRTDFALRIALAKTLARRAGTRLRTLIVDEGFGTQDSDGIDYLVDAINEISRDFDKLIVVTHLPELKNVFPVQIQVTKHPDVGSRFEIIEND